MTLAQRLDLLRTCRWCRELRHLPEVAHQARTILDPEPVTSPWVQRALARNLPAKEYTK